MKKIISCILISALSGTAVSAQEQETDQEALPALGKEDSDYIYVSDIKGIIPIISEAEISIQMGIDYTEGDYGDFENTKMTYLPLSVKYAKGPWSFRASIGYINLNGSNNIIPGSGLAQFSDQYIAPYPNDNGSNHGIGDSYLSGSYSLKALQLKNTYIDLTTRIKLPTGNAELGLSTGKTDVSLQVDIAKLYGDILPFATIGYRHMGKSLRYNLQDTWFSSLGFAYYATQDLSLGLSFDFRKATTIGTENPQEIQVFADYLISEKWSVYLYGIAGLSDGSPNQGVGLHLKFSY